MTRISSLFLILLVIGSLAVTSFAEELTWPIKRTIDLSSGFGDFRLNRFHTGIDLRTGGREGEKLYAPVDGFIYRVKMAYTGYGKGLYLKGTDNHIYVFAHLKDFNPAIDSFIKSKQREIKRYFIDIYPEKDALPVKKGELIGYTGQTGVGAPHLHFERRTADNIPLNPLKFGFSLNDTFKPIITQLGVKIVDDHTLLPNGTRKLFLDVSPTGTPGQYVLDTILYLNAPFGLLVDSYDQMRMGGMKQGVYKITYFVDDNLMYEVQLDSLNFETQRNAALEYDFVNAVTNKEKRIRRLFRKKGNNFAGSDSPNHTGGVWGEANEPIGIHQAKIIAEDCFGNASTLTFPFLWGPPDTSIFLLDSVSSIDSRTHTFFFTPTKGYENLQLDSVAVFLNRNNLWGEPPDSKCWFDSSGQLRCEVIGANLYKAVLKLVGFHKNAVVQDNLFNGRNFNGKLKTDFEYSILDDGLLLRMNVNQRIGSQARFDLYDGDKLLGTVYPQYFSMREYQAFVPPDPKYAHIDKIMYFTSLDSLARGKTIENLNIFLVGNEDNQKIKLNDLTLTFNKDTFYEPRFIVLVFHGKRHKVGMNMIIDNYEILPEAFVCKSDFEVAIDITDIASFQEQMAIYWQNPEDSQWVWLDTERDDNHFKTHSTGGGIFTIKVDLVPPEMKNLSIMANRTYRTSYPPIKFMAFDSLSGIGDDSSFLVKLDGDWIIPEFDPEGKRFTARPNKPLENGQHHLSIEIWDRAGNKTEQYLKFMVAGIKQK